jgi:hypothetical protein
MEQEQKGFSAYWIILIIFLVFIFGFGGWFFWRFFGGTDSSNSTTTTKPSASIKIDATLAGTWESECLVPDPNSKWAEKHKIVISANNTAIHTRQSWDMNDCTTVQPSGTITDTYKLASPSSGKINLTWTAYASTGSVSSSLAGISSSDFIGKTIYDIYKVSGNTLEFGHGFRGDNLAYGAKTGGSEADRFDSLNTYIVYKKK